MGKSTPVLLRSSTWRHAAKTGELPRNLGETGLRKKFLVEKIWDDYLQLSTDIKPVEYVYKNEYASQLWNNHPENLCIQFEYPISDSWADILIITTQGIRVVEIKTKRDTPNRLSTQISDYKKLTPNVSLMIDSHEVGKYSDICVNNNIGLLALNVEDNKFSNIRDGSLDDYSLLDQGVLIDLLRDKEQQQVIRVLGDTPYGAETANILRWRQNRNMLYQYDIKDLYNAVSYVVAQSRSIPQYLINLLESCPTPLTAALLQVSPNRPQCERIGRILL